MSSMVTEPKKLINYQYLRNEVDISQNVSDDELDNPIKRAQEMLEMVIGNALYDELQTEFPNLSISSLAGLFQVAAEGKFQIYPIRYTGSH
jgi:hypothetical protein